MPIGLCSAKHVRMNTTEGTSGHNWREDLLASRDLCKKDIEGFGFLVGWFEDWRVHGELAPGRNSIRRFWRELVLDKNREARPLEQWESGLRWYLECMLIHP